MNQEVTVIEQHPLGLTISFDAQREFTALLQLQPNLVANSLNLLRIGAGAKDEVVGERSDASEIQNFYVGRFFGFSGSGCR